MGGRCAHSAKDAERGGEHAVRRPRSKMESNLNMGSPAHAPQGYPGSPGRRPTGRRYGLSAGGRSALEARSIPADRGSPGEPRAGQHVLLLFGSRQREPPSKLHRLANRRMMALRWLLDAWPRILLKHEHVRNMLFLFGAGGETRTRTPIRATDFESVVSTDSTTPAQPGF